DISMPVLLRDTTFEYPDDAIIPISISPMPMCATAPPESPGLVFSRDASITPLATTVKTAASVKTMYLTVYTWPTVITTANSTRASSIGGTSSFRSLVASILRHQKNWPMADSIATTTANHNCTLE